MTNEELLEKLDQFANAASGLGTAADDRALSTFLLHRPFLDQTQLEDLYRTNPMAKRIVNRPAQDMTREGFELEDLDTLVDMAQLQAELDRLQAMKWMQLGMRWARLYGGALGIIAVNDRQPLHVPMGSCTQIKGLHVVDRFNAHPHGTRYKLQKSGFAIPEVYDVRMPDGRSQRVHKSRTVRFEGVPLPLDLLKENQFWGMSELEAPYDDIRRLSVVRQYLENFVHETSIVVMKIAGLREMLAAKDPDGGDPKQRVADALQDLRRQATNFHWLGLDADDSYSMESKPTSGLEALEDTFKDAAVMSTDMPRSIMLGETPGGLNSGENAGEIRSYYDWIGSEQDEKLTPIASTLVRTIFRCFHARSVQTQPETGAEVWQAPTRFSIKWPSLWQQSEEGSSEQASKDAATDKLYIDMGATTVAEVRQKRLVEGLTGPLRVEEAEEAENRTQGRSLGVATAAAIASFVEQVTTGLMPAASAKRLAKLTAPDLNDEDLDALFNEAGAMGAVAAQTAAELEEGLPEGEGEEEGETDVEAPDLLAAPSPDPAAPAIEPPPADLKPAKEIAARLGISPSTIKTMARKGEIRYWKFGTQYRYSVAEVFGANQGSAAQEEIAIVKDEDEHIHYVNERPTGPAIDGDEGHVHAIVINGEEVRTGPPVPCPDGTHYHVIENDGGKITTSCDTDVADEGISGAIILPSAPLPPATDT